MRGRERGYLGVEACLPLGPEADVHVEAHGTLRHVTVGYAKIPQDLELIKTTHTPKSST